MTKVRTPSPAPLEDQNPDTITLTPAQCVDAQEPEGSQGSEDQALSCENAPVSEEAAQRVEQHSRKPHASKENVFSNLNPSLEAGEGENAARQFIYPLTDHGNAQMFVRLFYGLVKFVEGLCIFIVWNGFRWLREDMGGKADLMRIVKKFLLQLYAQAKLKKSLYTLNGECVSPDDATKWAKQSSSHGRVKAMLEFVKGFPGVRVSQVELDSNPYLLGVANGVLNLLTGQLVPNTPKLLITRYARAMYNPKARPVKFLEYINQVCMGRQDLVDFVQEVLGYSLSGLTKEQAFFILLGTGANGKSTLVETFFHLLGDYAKGLPAHTFIKSESRAIRNDLARLPGVRFAPCAEVNTGKSLDESAVKRTTGGDVITARFIGREYFDFHLVAKFFFSVNTLPRVVGADNGIYRRLVVIPFDGNFEKTMDKELPEKLKGEIDGILTWALKGFQRWHKRGYLVKPDCVIDACKAYRAEMDTVQSFLDDACQIDPKATTPLSTLYDAYQQWAKGALVDPANKHLFGTLLGQKGFRKAKSGTWRWQGIALKSAPQASPNTLFAGLSQPAQAGPTQ